MDVIVVAPLIVLLLILKYHFTDHDTKTDKEKKLFAEGIALYEVKDYAKAFDYFNQILKENRKSAVAFAYRGKCNLIEDNFYSALYDFTQALSFDNTLIDVHFDKGKTHYQLEEYNDAFLSFDKAVWFSSGTHPEAINWRNEAQEKLIFTSDSPQEVSKKIF